MKETSNIKYYVRAILFAAILLILDQVTKYLAVIHLKNQNPAVLIQNVFEFQYLENRGAAFSILEGKKWFFIPLTIAFLFVMLYRKISARDLTILFISSAPSSIA